MHHHRVGTNNAGATWLQFVRHHARRVTRGWARRARMV